MDTESSAESSEGPATPTGITTLNTRVTLRPASDAGDLPQEPRSNPSESSDDGYRMSPAAARRFARRNLRRTSPTPDLVTSLVRPPSPDAFYMSPRVHSRVRLGTQTGPGGATPYGGRRRGNGVMPTPHASSLDIPKPYGGACVFDMYSLIYATEPDPNLLCPICHDPMVDPVTTPCDHTFCYRCLRRSIASSPSGTACPIDREPLYWPDCSASMRLVRTQLNALVVKCPNYNRGCSREVRRETVESHATTECRFREFSCPGTSCDKKLRHKPLDDVCRHHESNCTYCDGTIEEADRELHLLSCTKSKTRCESCWELVVRSQMALHHELDCDGVEVNCVYQDLGCPVRILRGEARSHSSLCAFHPESASGAVIRAQRGVIQAYGDLASQVEDMKAKQVETNRRIEELTSGSSRRGGGVRTDGDSVTNDNRTIQDLDAGFEEIHQNLTHLEARQSMWTLNQVMPIREEVTELRNNINMIRMHVNWLLNRSREEGRIRAANNSGSSSIRRDSSGEAAPVLPERRRSSGTETDAPRL